jgi:NAD(P)H-hydrate epimerase
MKILTAEQIRRWDAYTIQYEPVSSIGLMERAASKCMEWLVQNGYTKKDFRIYCGKGNNGGDGLAIARMLFRLQCRVSVYILEFGRKGSDDFQENLMRLHEVKEERDPGFNRWAMADDSPLEPGGGLDIFFIQSEDHFHPIPENNIVIDALYGSGLNRPLDGLSASLVKHINHSGNQVISIDIPSGMFADKTSRGNEMIRAKHTLSFQCYKLAFLVPENESFTGKVHILDIGLSPAFPGTIESDLEFVKQPLIKRMYRPRDIFSHKGTFGHTLLVAGSYGKMGAAMLSAKACLRAGTGLLSCFIPACGYTIFQTSVHEAMVMTDDNERFITSLPPADLSGYNAVAIGPGLGTDPSTADAVEKLLAACSKPVVIDADGLNIIAADKKLFEKIPPLSILTPHPKEFERLFGKAANDFEGITLALQQARETGTVIVLKGHHSFIALPGGKGYFNSTGNPGMATGGSGDVLTGILAGLLAQGYPPEDAAITGVYLHGLAGDLALFNTSEEALIASDIIDQLGKAFMEIRN